MGGGPFPTEAEGPTADRLRERGGEYGSTTGRPRRCGWLSIPDLRHAALINGFDCWNLTKLDVLDEEETIPVGVGMADDGSVLWERLPGWQTSTRGVRRIADLPPAAQGLLAFIGERTGVAVRYVGTGQGREDLAIRD